MLLNIFQDDAVINAIGLAVAGLITWGFTMIQIWLNSKIKDRRLREAVYTATEVTRDVVLSIQQTFVDQLKKDGKFDQKNQEKAFRKAMEKAKVLISEETKKLIEKNFGDFSQWLEVQIEALIKSIGTSYVR